MKKKEILHNVPLNYNEHQGVQGVIDEIAERYPPVKKIILYGSKARGDFEEDSDIDLLFITDKKPSRSFKNRIFDVIYNHELKNDIVISAIIMSESIFNNQVSTFLRKVKREGIVLWWRE
jgi:predicted nucleotidyltransferase